MVGIDKVMMTTKEFRIGSISKFKNSITFTTDEDGTPQPPKVWAVDKKGVSLCGKLYQQSRGVVVDVNDKGLRMVFNPSVLTAEGRLNHLTTDHNDMVKVNEILKSVCADLKIDTDINGHVLHRIDLAKDNKMKHPVEQYFPVMSAMDGKRMKVVGYPDGHSFRNGQREGMFYNRGLKVELDTGTAMDGSLARFEFRAKNKDEVSKRMKIARWHDLTDCDFDQLNSAYKNFLMNDVFRMKHSSHELAMLPSIEAAIIGQMTYKRYRNMCADMWLLENFGSVEAVRKTMEYGKVSKSARYRYIDQMHESIQLSKFMQTHRNKGKLTELYDEVFNKFVA